VVLATVLESAMASIDATVVGIALLFAGRWATGTVRPEADLPGRRRMVRAGPV
jgi:hypothetical protein